jgi:hypothetical protein
MYAVVAPGFSCVYSNWADVERIKALYPYPKWIKCHSEEEARAWIKRNSYGKHLTGIYNYGNTFRSLYIDAKYKIGDGCIYYVLDCSKVGHIRIHTKDVFVEYKGSKIYIKLPNIYVSNETTAGHMSAIHNLLKILGDYVDVNIELPYYSLFYCLTVYSKGNNRPVQLVKNLIEQRLGAVALSLKMENFSEEESAYVNRDDGT